MAKRNMTIKQFCDRHDACEDGREWALTNCKTMRDVWDTAKPEWLVWIATREGVLTGRELRLFACFCARQNWDLLTDERSRNAIEVAERYANGGATGEELFAAAGAAWAARAAAGAAWAAWDAWDAAGAAWAAAGAALVAAGAALVATRAAQSTWLRENTKPNFKAALDAGEGKA